MKTIWIVLEHWFREQRVLVAFLTEAEADKRAARCGEASADHITYTVESVRLEEDST